MKSGHLERTVAAPALILAAVCLLGGAGAAAAFESDSVGSFWGGLWWALCRSDGLELQILARVDEVVRRVEALERRLP